MRTIPVEQAEGHLAEIIAELSPCEEIVPTRDDKPVATIRLTTKLPETTPRKFGTLKGTILHIAPDCDAIPEGFEEYLP